MYHKTVIMQGQAGIDRDKQFLKDIEDTCRGSCIVIGHGISLDSIDLSRYTWIPKILINFYDPNIENVYGCLCWDKDIISDINRKLIQPIPVFYSGLVDINREKGNIHLDPERFPPNTESGYKIFTAARAIYLAQYVGFENIYLIGFDFIPHTRKNIGERYLVRHKETGHYINNKKNVNIDLQNQMDCFKYVKWKHNNIFQTNSDSKLKFFKYKPLEEVLNG